MSPLLEIYMAYTQRDRRQVAGGRATRVDSGQPAGVPSGESDRPQVAGGRATRVDSGQRAGVPSGESDRRVVIATAKPVRVGVPTTSHRR
jgi:hypothetical protein